MQTYKQLLALAALAQFIVAAPIPNGDSGVSSLMESLENVAGSAIGNLDGNGNGNAIGDGNKGNGNGNGSGSGNGNGSGNQLGNGNTFGRRNGEDAVSQLMEDLKNVAGSAVGNLDGNGNGNAIGDGNQNNGNGNGSGSGNGNGSGNQLGNGNTFGRRNGEDPVSQLMDDLKNVAGSAVDNLSGNGNGNDIGDGNVGNGNGNGSGSGNGNGAGNGLGNGNTFGRRNGEDAVSQLMDDLKNVAGSAVDNLSGNGNGNNIGDGNEGNGNDNGSGSGNGNGSGNQLGNGNYFGRRVRRDSTLPPGALNLISPQLIDELTQDGGALADYAPEDVAKILGGLAPTKTKRTPQLSGELFDALATDVIKYIPRE